MNQIERMLKSKGLRSKVLREEYLDHFCSAYENKLSSGTSPTTALHQIQREINNMDVKRAHQAYFELHFKNPILMTTAVLTILTILFFLPSKEPNSIAEKKCIEGTAFLSVLVSAEDPPTINPVPDAHFNLTSGFGMRMHPLEKMMKFHRGIDIKAAQGTPVMATSSGIVVEAGYHSKKGNFIEIKHDEVYSTRYWHLHSIDVEVDQEISIGTKIGEIGSTGMSFGPHLHYEVIKAGKNVDPGDYLKV